MQRNVANLISQGCGRGLLYCLIFPSSCHSLADPQECQLTGYFFGPTQFTNPAENVLLRLLAWIFFPPGLFFSAEFTVVHWKPAGQGKRQHLAKERKRAAGSGLGPSSFSGHKLWDWFRMLTVAPASLSSGSFLHIVNVCHPYRTRPSISIAFSVKTSRFLSLYRSLAKGFYIIFCLEPPNGTLLRFCSSLS